MKTNRCTVQQLLAGFLSVALLVGLLPAPAMANPQVRTEPFVHGMFFNSLQDCMDAYAAGPEHFRFYQPDPKNLKSPKDMNRNAKGSPVAWCVQEDARKETPIKEPWMIIAANVPLLFGPDNIPVRDARCDNNIHEAVELPLPTGPQGPAGDQGEKGDRGDRGETGERGERGLQGEKGDRGDQGPEGKEGPQGPRGVQGEKGKDKGHKLMWGAILGLGGAVAYDLLKGSGKGDKGDKGDTGAPGATGSPGPAGPAGACGGCAAGLPETPGRK